MGQQLSISYILLFLFVVVLGIELGGGLYETLVVMPVWSAGAPDSVLAFYQHNLANPKFVLNAGGRFWMFFTPLTGLTALACLLSGLRTAPEHKKWRIAGSALALIVVIFTFVWFVPNIIKLNSAAILSMSRDDLASLTNWWVRLNWVRAVLYIAGWLAAIRALSIPSK